MTVTRRAPGTRGRRPPPAGNFLFLPISLAAVSTIVLTGVLLFLQARSPDFLQIRQGLDSGQMVNLNAISSPSQLLPYLGAYHNDRVRAAAAQAIWNHVEQHRPVEGLQWLRSTLAPVTESLRASDPDAGLNPATGLHQIFLVRTTSEFTRLLWLSVAICIVPFYFVAGVWWWRDFRGDFTLLAPLHLITGMAFITMLSLSNPARDQLLFPNFSQGIAFGTLLLTLPAFSFFDYRRLSGFGLSVHGRQLLIWAPLSLIAALLLCLKLFGNSPTGDANVNLWGFQPVELIKVLVVIFYAGYFSQKWGQLRDLREKGFGMRSMPFHLPKFKHLLPLIVSTAFALIVFKMLNDLGPALIVACLFLLLYGVALARPGLPAAGFALLIAAFVAASWNLLSPKLAIRIGMWSSPWENTLRGGDQLVKSFWGLATGGPFGSGIGWGDAWLIPTNHTDMIYSSIGEEWGFCGLLGIFMVYGWFAFRSFRIARRAPSEYGFFLVLGSSLLLLLEAIVIIGGVTGAIPLSGVAAPFLCWGRTSMVVNFFLVALILSVSSRETSDEPVRTLFEEPQRWTLAIVTAVGCILLVRTAWLDVVRADDIFGRSARVLVENVRSNGTNARTAAPGPRTIQATIYNPRIELVESLIPRGDIYDRNGILLATSLPDHLQAHRADLQQLGVSIDRCCPASDQRVYPFASLTYHLLGDNIEKARFGASDTAFVERVANGRLRGYETSRDILPAVRRRRQPDQPELAKLLLRDRDVHLTIDMRLQQRAQIILADALTRAHKTAGAVIVLDVDTGSILASVNLPAPIDVHPEEPRDPLLVRVAQRSEARDNLRPFEDVARFGAYPPGSTFKLVTAIAALRKNPALLTQPESCVRLDDGRTGAKIKGYGNKVIHDDVGDLPHGTLTMADALRVSCNAYFAQLATYQVGAAKLAETASLFGIRTVKPGRDDASIPDAATRRLQKLLPDSGYGQGEVTASPLQMALVSSTIANQGGLIGDKLIAGSTNDPAPVPQPILSPASAAALAQAMRNVVISGTAHKFLAGSAIEIAGKTGTAQIDARPGANSEDNIAHSWFTGFAPYDGNKKIAFAVFVEHGGYGGALAAPIAGELVAAARSLGII
jgi:cell division protein FtsI/penicillin-binding protein 2/cell division protein FtsW (lipid II flippase)